MIDIRGFKGEIPKISSKLLPSGYAASSYNCDFESGNLQPVKGNESVQDIGADITTIYDMDGSFLQWAENVNVVKSLVADSGNRIMFTGAGYPKETNATLSLVSSPFPTNTRRLGIPAPTNALTITLDGTAGTDLVHSSSYVYTIVAKWEDGSEIESGPSEPTAVFDVYDGITPILTNFINSVVTGVFTTHFRIYRLNDGDISNSEYQYVDEIAIDILTYSDEKTDDDLLEVLPTEGQAAPVENLIGLIAASHGLVIGFYKNKIYPSEIFINYTFPDGYTLPTESDIVGMGYTGSLVVVLTNTVPYLLIGSDPLSLSMQRLGYKQKCVSARSIINFPGGVAYASPNGLYSINEAGTGTLLTKNLFKKKQWKALDPETLFGFYYDDSYVGFFSGTKTGFSLHLETGEYKSITTDENVYGGTYSAYADMLYLIQTKAAIREIVSFQSGDLVDCGLTSKIFETNSSKTYTAGRVSGDFTAGTATLSFYADGVLAGTKVVTDDKIFRINLPMCLSMQVKVVGLATIDRIMIGLSAIEIVKAVD